MTREVERYEDTGRGRLTLMQCDDGDIHVTIREQGEMDFGSSVEFCLSGCGSPHTMTALRDLMAAMARDDAERPQAYRGTDRER